jgi:hypothetical protein
MDDCEWEYYSTTVLLFSKIADGMHQQQCQHNLNKTLFYSNYCECSLIVVGITGRALYLYNLQSLKIHRDDHISDNTNSRILYTIGKSHTLKKYLISFRLVRNTTLFFIGYYFSFYNANSLSCSFVRLVNKNNYSRRFFYRHFYRYP